MHDHHVLSFSLSELLIGVLLSRGLSKAICIPRVTGRPSLTNNTADPEQDPPLPSTPLHSKCALYSSPFPPPPTLAMRCPPTFVQLPTASASSVCDGLLRMAHCLITTLPASELRSVHYTLESLLARTEQLLESAEFDLSLDFDDLVIAPGKPYILFRGYSCVFMST